MSRKTRIISTRDRREVEVIYKIKPKILKEVKNKESELNNRTIQASREIGHDPVVRIKEG